MTKCSREILNVLSLGKACSHEILGKTESKRDLHSVPH